MRPVRADRGVAESTQRNKPAADRDDVESQPSPLVSVIVLSFNTGEFVVEALECLRQQTYQHFEVVLVDDGSTDDSVATIRRWVDHRQFEVTILESDTNHGIASSLNRAISRTRGEYVTWLCDDLWEPSRLETSVECFGSLPDEVSVLFGDAVLIDEGGREIGTLSPARTIEVLRIPNPTAMIPVIGSVAVIPGERMREALFHRCVIPAPTVMVRRRLYDEIGLYDETLAIEDLDCWFRASDRTSFAYLRVPLVRYRTYSGSLTSGRSTSYLTALDETLRRHAAREGGGRRATIKRHLREEAYRVTTGLLADGLTKPALWTARKFYVPNFQPSATCLKETARLAVSMGRAAAGTAIRVG